MLRADEVRDGRSQGAPLAVVHTADEYCVHLRPGVPDGLFDAFFALELAVELRDRAHRLAVVDERQELLLPL